MTIRSKFIYLQKIKNMNAGNANFLNAIVLVGMGMCGYLGSLSPSPTALIPVFIGVILFVMTNFVRNHHKVVSHIAVVLTLVILIALIKPLTGAMERSDSMAMIRIGLMMLTSAIAFVVFIKSFIDAKKASKK